MILTERRPEGPARPPASPPAGPTVACPDCEGSGVTHHNIARDSNGVWTSDTTDCTSCAGAGVVSEELAVACAGCGTRTTWRGTHHADHDDLCEEHRPRGCGDCCDAGGWDAEGYYEGRAS